MVTARRSRTAARTIVVWEALRDALAERSRPGGLDVLDAGGGSGGFAVPLAELGHRVTVLDPSPDSLAALERRAAEAGITTVRGLQGDLDSDLDLETTGLLDTVDPKGYDVVLCHDVLDIVDDPTTAVATLVRVLRPGGLLSVLVPNRGGAVLARAVAGRFDEAVQVLADPAGRGAPTDALTRRFDRDALVRLLEDVGVTVHLLQGARVVADLLPGALLDADPAMLDALVRLERALCDRPEFVGVAAALHVLASRR